MQIERSEPTKLAKSAPKIAVYTCITQGYDSLKIPQVTDERLSYYCFSDSSQNVIRPWVYMPIALEKLSPKDQNRYIKMHPHEYFPDHDITIYVDGNIKVVGDLYSLICSVLSRPEDIFMYQHPWRNCIYAEAAACAHFSHDWIWNIAYQMRGYSRAGYPVEYDLYEASIIIRKDSASVRRLMDAWWTEYISGVKRDQLSFTFVAWREHIPVGSLGESDSRFGHCYFLFVDHPSRRKLIWTVRKYVNKVVSSLISYERLFGLSTPVRWKKS